MVKVISGFPGVGKTYYKRNTKLKVLDSDSSKFSWIDIGVRNPEFPKNYLDHIKYNLDKVDIISVSSHKVVRDALVENKIEFILAYPNRTLRDEYLMRFKKRGSGDVVIKRLKENWNNFMDEMEIQECFKKIELRSGEFLSDYIKE